MHDALTNQSIALIADPAILAISIRDNGEPMIDIGPLGTLRIGPSPEIPNNRDYTKMRKTVYEKLLQAEKSLPEGLHFCLYESFRSLTLQKMLFDARYAKLKKHYPDWSHTDLFRETTRLVSPVMMPNGEPNTPPHSTGGAIDVYLVDAEGNALEMGIHPKDWMDDNTGERSLTASTTISATARKNRDIMSHALATAGFANYPGEYWHWSYGDRYWAWQQGQSHAIYDSVSS